MHQDVHMGDYRVPINFIRRNNHRVWISGTEFVVDEMMIQFHGTWKWRQYIPRKSRNTGLKLFAASDTCRFLVDFFLF